MSEDESNIQTKPTPNANGSRRRLIYSSIWYVLITIVYGLLVYGVITQSPIDFYRIFEYTFFFAVVLFSSVLLNKGLFSRPEVLRSRLWIAIAVVCWGVFIFPVVTRPPIDYTLLFAYTIVFALCIYYQVKPATSRRKRTNTEDDKL